MGFIQVDLLGDKELGGKLNVTRYRSLAAQGMRAGALHIKGVASSYPGVRRGSQPPKTDRQRRFLHWAVRNGVIGIPYRRTGRLARGWDIARVSAFSATVQNRVAHGPITQGAGSQAHYHSVTGWSTEKSIAAKEGAAIARLIEREIARLF